MSQARLGFTLSPHKVALSVLIQDLCTPERVPIQARPVLSVFLLQQVKPPVQELVAGERAAQGPDTQNPGAGPAVGRLQ